MIVKRHTDITGSLIRSHQVTAVHTELARWRFIIATVFCRFAGTVEKPVKTIAITVVLTGHVNCSNCNWQCLDIEKAKYEDV